MNAWFQFGPFTDENPCTPAPDTITMFGRIHLSGRSWETEPGAGHFEYGLNQHTEGVDSGGTRYAGNAEVHQVGSYVGNTVEYTTDLRVRLTSQGAGDNLWIRTKVRVSIDYPQYHAEVLKQELECRG